MRRYRVIFRNDSMLVVAIHAQILQPIEIQPIEMTEVALRSRHVAAASSSDLCSQVAALLVLYADMKDKGRRHFCVEGIESIPKHPKRENVTLDLHPTRVTSKRQKLQDKIEVYFCHM